MTTAIKLIFLNLIRPRWKCFSIELDMYVQYIWFMKTYFEPVNHGVSRNGLIEENINILVFIKQIWMLLKKLRAIYGMCIDVCARNYHDFSLNMICSSELHLVSSGCLEMNRAALTFTIEF